MERYPQDMKVLFLIDMLELGGIQRQLLEVAGHLSSRGQKCVVGCFRTQGDAMSGLFRTVGVDVAFLGKRRMLDISFLLRLQRMIARGGFSLVHAMTPQAGFWAGLVMGTLSRAGRPVLLTSLLNTHEFGPHSGGVPPCFRAKRWIERWITARRADAVLVNSAAGKRRYLEVTRGDASGIRVIRNGVRTCADSGANRAALREELGIQQDDFAVCCLGRLVPVKGHVHALEAAKAIIGTRSGNRVKVFLIGDGPCEAVLRESYGALFEERRARILPARPGADALLPAFDAFLMPSLSEGLPNALLEAMAAGLPCIASAVGGIPEVVEDGRNGILVPPGDSRAIAAALLRILDDPSLRENLAQEARAAAVRRFGMKRMLRRTEAFYRGLLRKRRAGVAYVISQFPALSETFILREIVEMRRRGIPVAIITLKPGQRSPVMHPDCRRLEPQTIDRPWLSPRVVWDNVSVAARNPLRYLRAAAGLAALEGLRPLEAAKALAAWPKMVSSAAEASRRGCVHIHAHWATIPASCALAAARLFRFGFSFTAHAHDIYWMPMALESKTSAAAFVATCTARNLGYLRRILPETLHSRLHLVRHFLRVPEVRSAVRSARVRPILVSVGSLVPYKGFDVLLEAAGRLSRAGETFQLRIVGAGKLDAQLRSRASHLFAGSPETVVFAGAAAQEQVFEELRNADIFVLASVRMRSGPEDNLPNVLVEAALAGLPVAASRIGSLEELIVHEETGLLHEPGDCEELAKCLLRLMKDRPFACQLGAAARERAQRLFSVEENAGRLEVLLRSSAGLPLRHGASIRREALPV